mgnify:CR=1 FL=1
MKNIYQIMYVNYNMYSYFVLTVKAIPPPSHHDHRKLRPGSFCAYNNKPMKENINAQLIVNQTAEDGIIRAHIKCHDHMLTEELLRMGSMPGEDGATPRSQFGNAEKLPTGWTPHGSNKRQHDVMDSIAMKGYVVQARGSYQQLD